MTHAEQSESDVVRSREEFVAFVRSLVEDWRSNGTRWENRELATFLDALAAWTEDMDGYYEGRGETSPHEPSWQVVADMLAAARIYE